MGVDVIVLGLSPTGLYAVREAARAGRKVLGVGDPGAVGLWSVHLAERFAAATPEARVAFILERFPKGAGTQPLLIVTSDQDLDAVLARAGELEAHVHLQGSYRDGLAARIMDKASFYRLCEENGVAYPSVWTAPVDQAALFRDVLAYPCMVKPARIQDVKHLMGGRKGWIVKSAAAFERTVSTIPAEAGTLVMQEIVPGPESEITLWCGYIDAEGKVRQRFTARKLRQYPPGFGSASLVQSEQCRETAEIAEHLLTSIGYRGIAAAEFKRSPETGALKIIEVNPRPSLWFSVSTASGVPLVETAISEARGAPLPPLATQRDGVRWRYGLKDLASELFYARSRDFVLPAPDVNRSGRALGQAEVVGARDDLMPAVRELWTFACKGSGRVAERLRGKR